MSSLSLRVKDLAKSFNRRWIFRDVSFDLSAGASLAITGRNGAGKSTMVKILSGILSPTSGTVEYAVDGKIVKLEELKHNLGLVSPYLQLYDEFSGSENLELLTRIRARNDGVPADQDGLLKRFNMWDQRNDFVRNYSSGMKQRLKYAFALLHRPLILILDEPTSSLDSEGSEVVRAVAQEQVKQGILIVATNEEAEARWCQKHLHLGA